MGDLKPLGSEKLKNDEKMKRILELTYYKQGNNKTSDKPELVKESKTGGVYGIVKEKDGYYVKRGLNESTLDYIGGLFMKNKNRFSSYAEALKRLEFIKGQEELQLNEATKYVLKTKQKSEDVPMPDPSMDMPPADPSLGDTPTMDASVPDSPDASSDVEGDPSSMEGGEQKRSDYMAEIQKYAGKLGQELRDQKERMESDDIKYVLNMIISAVDLDKLDPEDLEEISDKFEMDEEDSTDDMGDVSSDDTEVPAEEPSGEEEEDLGEVTNPMAELEEFIDEPIDVDEIDFSKYALGEENDDDTVELDLDEIKNEINQSVNQTLSKYFK